jgi:hypothetical protein
LAAGERGEPLRDRASRAGEPCQALSQSIPDLERVIDVAANLDISKEAAARRYVELCERPIAIVFGQNGIVRYFERHQEFPPLSCHPKQRLASCETTAYAGGLTAHVQADPSDWLARPPRGDLLMQCLLQGGGYSMTLLMLDDGDPEDVEL